MSTVPLENKKNLQPDVKGDPTQDRPPMQRRVKQRLTSRKATAAAVIIAVIWTIPTFGLLISSFRPEDNIKGNGWWNVLTDRQFTLENYADVLSPGGSQSPNLLSYFVNSLAIVIPGTVFTLVLGSMAAYMFAWGRFRGKDNLFIFVFALQIVPLQMALIPLLQLFTQVLTIGDFQLLPSGTYAQLWVAHTIFGLPLAIFLLHNFIAEIPGEVIEAARVDGAGHSTIFWRIIVPLATPALASFGIFQFLWLWNDLLVALVFSGGGADVAPITQRLAELQGSRGGEWQRLTAGAFVSIIVPLAVFFGLQRYFVRGLLAGGLKG
ncbi:carbohydrate ABC transporter permease [Arthrobacter agilis]|uniref:carbohydrate ABC transporter permease n=1 Tax=Arthrobacter agilis TaxID=37921 RepID=UPI000B34F4C6|nr:carbohydrate ABC transporter permease [Arthrobacter agilis]OUM43612.1 sugar ABC transporter permease [Arthrobacter agilis]PPB46801.1 carbohydrate ABC transporter permease [Arthrobacter agilis]TPV24857.1 carbohydrate ABC transporter permease [Arthrobacter agilis]VDR31009.1 Inner membrane ABC transporter permease protein ycjP [Arthrobacter agilis]